MGLPRKLKNFALFVDGENYMGEVPEVTLPTLTRQMDDYRGGGMNMPVGLGAESGMPVGVQLISPQFKAENMLRAAAAEGRAQGCGARLQRGSARSIEPMGRSESVQRPSSHGNSRRPGL